ncbi:death-inducer obliterator 1 isoform X2 [Myxocyprinus asiaticus]|uniref:death-inducer obliterator 1 isoform X2 n=1 Tax=Myxocyprinus asiaticus TaxID=70543 RepID=UPI0022222A51|nr:death-inducer obliterator 1 isoform X2 [Myxocyprinus asiaticus]
MEEEASKETVKTWGFRRSTIARREFLEAVGSVDSIPPPAPSHSAQGRGRGRGRGKQTAASKRGRGGRGRALAPVLTPADEKFSTEDEAMEADNALQGVVAELKSGEESLSEGIVSDQVKDSDDLTLREIRKRAVARRLEELKHGGHDGVNSEDTDVGTRLLLEQDHVNVLDTTEDTSGGNMFSSTAGQACGDSVAVTGARKAVGGARRAERVKTDGEFAEEKRETEEEEESKRMDQDAVCSICQQTHNNRSMICCDSCREWCHTDCVGITEAHDHFLQKSGKQYMCPSCSEDHITRKIKSTSRITIFHAEEIVVESLMEEQNTREEEVKVEEKEQKMVDEKVALPSCIGPGCSNAALPESVYCGHQCIVQHAAAAMKNLSEPKTETKPTAKSAEIIKSQKRSFLAKLFKVKISEKAVQEETGSKQEVMKGESVCPAAVTDPEKPTSITTSSDPAVDDKHTIEDRKEVECNTDTPQSQLSDLTLDSLPPEKAPAAPPIKKSTPGRARKTMPGSPRLELLRGTLIKNPFPVAKKPSESTATSESIKHPDVRPAADEPVAVPLSSPLQIRQNIRRSLTEILLQRLNASDGLNISESEVEKLAVNMEKEMFSMCYTTGGEYKSKYQHLKLSLKDPKNKELCHQVLKKEISPVKLIHLSQQNTKSVEECTGDPVLQRSLKKVPSSLSTDIEEHPPVCPETVVNVESKQSLSKSAPSEVKSSLTQLKQSQTRKINSDVPDVISSMLKDTTPEHKRHLFDLNCRICTGQVSTEGEPEPKKPKMEKTKDDSVEEKHSSVVQVMEEAPPPIKPVLDADVMESPASPNAEDCETQTPSVDFSPVLIPSVSTVSISRRDPRTAQYRLTPTCSGPTVVSPPQQHPPPVLNVSETTKEIKPIHPLHVPPPMPKSILMKPSHSSASRVDTLYGSTTRLLDSPTPSDKGTRQFLSKQDTLWKGFLNMPTVAKFVTKGYLISGSPDFLKEDLPDTIQIGGRILPQTVWEYVELIKTSDAKVLSLIRFHPSSDEEEVAYVSLFSYFNSRRRFGVVSNISKHIKDLYLIPLCAKQSMPDVLLPIDGPGLEQNHPNLLIGLAVCQKPKQPEALPQEFGEKKSRSLIRSEKKETSNPTSLNTLIFDVGQHNTKACDTDIPINTNVHRPLPLFVSPDPPCSARSLSGPSSLSSVLTVSKPTTSINTDPSKDSFCTTPLQTILNTLFGQKKQHSYVPECKMSSSTDEVQQQQMCKETINIIELCDDRPYDPEEYDPATTFGAMEPTPAEVVESKVLTAAPDDNDYDDDRPYDPEEEYNAVDKGVKNNIPKVSEAKTIEETTKANSDVAYDPEDETVFEEMQSYLTSNAIPHKADICEQVNISSSTLSEQQKILEELNRQIEEQKRQLEEQTETLRLHKEAIGVSMAHFSVSDALMSPPPSFGREEEEKMPFFPTVYKNRDAQTCQKTSQDAANEKPECEAVEKESATQELLNMEEEQNVVLDTKKEKSAYDETKPKEGSPDIETGQSHITKGSHSEYSSKTRDEGSRSILITNRSTRRSRHERRSYHQDRASSRALHKNRDPKDDSDKRHRSRQSAEHVSQRSHSDRKRLTSSRTRRDHHHRDSSRKRRSHNSTSSRSCRRDRSSQDGSYQSHKTDQQEPGPFAMHSTQSSQPDSDLEPGSNQMQSPHKLRQSGKLQCDTATNQTTNQLQRGHETDQSNQKPQASQNAGEDSLQSFYSNQPFTGHSEMNRDNVPLNKIDQSSKQGSLLPSLGSGNVAHDQTFQPTNITTAPPQVQKGILHLDSESQSLVRGAPSNQPPLNQIANVGRSRQIIQKRGLPLIQKHNYFQHETEKLCPGDNPEIAFSQSDPDQFYCRDITRQELPQKERSKLLVHEEDHNNQLDHRQFDHQNYPNNMLRRGFLSEDTDLLHESSFQEPETDRFHHNNVKKQNFQRDESAQFQERESILGPAPVQNKSAQFQQKESILGPAPMQNESAQFQQRESILGPSPVQNDSAKFQQRESLLGPAPVHMGSFRPPNPNRPRAPLASCYDKWKPSGEPPTLPMMEQRGPKFGQHMNANPSALEGSRPFQNFGLRVQSPGFVMHESSGLTKDRQPKGPFTEKMFESVGPSQTIGPRGPSPGPCPFQHGMDGHSGLRQLMHDRAHLQLNSVEPVSPPNVAGPSEEELRDLQLPHCNSSKGYVPHRQFHKEQFDKNESYPPHFNYPRGCAPFKEFHEGQSDYKCFSHEQPNGPRGHSSPHNAYEPQHSNCHQTFADDEEDYRTQTCILRQAQIHSQDPTCGPTHSQFEGQQYSEIRGKTRGVQQSEFRGRGRGNVGTFFQRHHEINVQIKGPRFESPQQLMGQREASTDFHGQRRPSPQNIEHFEDHNEAQSSDLPHHSTSTPTQFNKTRHSNLCESLTMGQQRPHVEGLLRQTNILPLRRSGPLLPTPPGGPIRPLIPRVPRPNFHKECNRPQGPTAIREGHVTEDISGPLFHGEKPRVGHNFNPQQSANSKSVIQKEQRVGHEDRRREQSVLDSSYGQPCRRSRGRNGRSRAGKMERFVDKNQDNRGKEMSRDIDSDRRDFCRGRARARGRLLQRNDRSRSHSDWSRSQDLDYGGQQDYAIDRHQN